MRKIKVKTKTQTGSVVKPTIKASKKKSLSIYFISILFFIHCFIWSFLGVVITAAQNIFGKQTLEGEFILTACYIFSPASAVLGIGLFKLNKKAYFLGIGMSFSVIFWVYYLIMLFKPNHEIILSKHNLPLLFLVFFNVIIILLLAINKRHYYVRKSLQPIKEIEVKAPKSELKNCKTEGVENLNLEYKEKLIFLNKMIKEEKNKFWRSKHKQKIIIVLKELSYSPESAKNLLKEYKNLFTNDLVTEVTQITSSYEQMKEYLTPLIELKIVTKDYPHNRIVK